MRELRRYQRREESKRWKEGGDSREDDGKPCWFSSVHSEGAPGEKEERGRRKGEEDKGKEVRDW